jgi:hypothetical protein
MHNNEFCPIFLIVHIDPQMNHPKVIFHLMQFIGRATPNLLVILLLDHKEIEMVYD